VNFPFIYINIPKAPACIYLSQLIRYSRACGYYKDFLDGGLLLKGKVLNQGYLLVKFKSSLRKLYCPDHDLDNFVTEYLCHKWPRICPTCRKHFPVLSSSWLITRFVTRVQWQVPLVEQELLTFHKYLGSLPVFSGVHVARSLVFCVKFCFLIVPLCCLVIRFTDYDYPFGIFKHFL